MHQPVKSLKPLKPQVYMRKGRLLLALGAVRRAVALGTSAHPEVHQAVLALCQKGAAAITISFRAVLIKII